MRFFKIIEIDEDSFNEEAGGFFEGISQTTVCIDGIVYIAIDDVIEDQFEVCLDDFEEE